MMSTPCNQFGEEKETERAEKARIENLKNIADRDIGERIGADTAVNKLGFNGEFFDQPYHGVDAVCRDGNGKLVLIEAKFTNSTSPRSNLGKTNFGRQLSPTWNERKAELMQNPTSTQYSPDNAKIGKEIQNVGGQNVRSIVVHTHKETLKVTAYERQPNGSYKQLGSWESLPQPGL